MPPSVSGRHATCRFSRSFAPARLGLARASCCAFQLFLLDHQELVFAHLVAADRDEDLLAEVALRICASSNNSRRASSLATRLRLTIRKVIADMRCTRLPSFPIGRLGHEPKNSSRIMPPGAPVT